MKKSEMTIQLHKPSIRELLFFLLSGAIVSVPLTLFIEQNFATPLLTGFSTFDITIISVAIFAPFVEEFAKVFPLVLPTWRNSKINFHSCPVCRNRFRNCRIHNIRCHFWTTSYSKPDTRIIFPPSKHFDNSLWNCHKETTTVLFGRCISSLRKQLLRCNRSSHTRLSHCAIYFAFRFLAIT